MDGFNACCCALPSLRGIECCKRCANNPWKDKDHLFKEWQKFNIDDIKKGRMEVEYDDDGSIIKITYYN